MNRKNALAAMLIFAAGLASQAQAAPITFHTVLAGANQNPVVASPGTGFATAIYDDLASTLGVHIEFTGLIGATTVAHIHCCVDAPGNVGVASPVPTFPGFPAGVTSGVYDYVLDLTMASSFSAAFIGANGGTAAGAQAALLGGLVDGRAYVNIHTTAFPGGEIRGFLAVPEPAALALFGIGLAGLMSARRRVRQP